MNDLIEKKPRTFANFKHTKSMRLCANYAYELVEEFVV